MNNTNVLELRYLTDVDVSSYTGQYDMQIAYLFGLYLVCTGERKSWPTPDCGQSSFKSSFKTSFKSYFESSLLLCLMSSVLSPFIVVLNAPAFGCILNFWLTYFDEVPKLDQ